MRLTASSWYLEGVCLLMVSSYEFDALNLQSLDPWDALQRVTSVVRLARFNCYSRYIFLKGVDNCCLSIFL